jgi:hypothetical protein
MGFIWWKDRLAICEKDRVLQNICLRLFMLTGMGKFDRAVGWIWAVGSRWAAVDECKRSGGGGLPSRRRARWQAAAPRRKFAGVDQNDATEH